MPRPEGQKLRVLYVAKFFLEYSDENHYVTSKDILDYLEEEHDIFTDRRTIYRDIAVLRDGLGFDIEGGQGGRYRLVSRDFELDDLRILAECVYAAKFISEPKAKELVEALSGLCSSYQAEELQSETFLTDRVKSTQKGTLNIIATIRSAMATKCDGKPHTPQKISFHYLHYTIQDKNTPVPRWGGRRFVVSPYKLLINDGNYYLLAYADNVKTMRTYRIDRMKDVQLERSPRVGQSEYDKIDMATYVKRTLFMIPGEPSRVSILFDNSLLDTVIDRFGTGADVFYRPEGDKHFVVSIDVNVTDQFFGWLCGFGTKAKILGPENVQLIFSFFLDKIREKYKQ